MHLFEKAPAFFKLADINSEGIISWFFKYVVCKTNLDDIIAWNRSPLVLKSVSASLKQTPTCFEAGFF